MSTRKHAQCLYFRLVLKITIHKLYKENYFTLPVSSGWALYKWTKSFNNQNLFRRFWNWLMLSAITTSLGKLFHIGTTLLVYFLKSYLQCPHCKIIHWICTSDGRFGKKENDSIRFDSIHCSVRTPVDSPHQGFWTLVLKLLDQSTEAITGRPPITTEMPIAFVEVCSDIVTNASHDAISQHSDARS